MSGRHIFISHATGDDDFVRELRGLLETHWIPVWVDSRNLRGGDKLRPEIERAIREARHVLLVLSPQTANSAWVQDEVKLAEKVASERRNDFRVIPILLPGVLPGALGLWFDDPPVAHMVRLEPGGLSEAMPQILAALGEQAVDDPQKPFTPPAEPVADLVLELEDPQFRRSGGRRTLSATATLVHHPATPGAAVVKSRRFRLTAPIGPIEADDLRWYLEQYHIWPVGVFQDRAKRIEKSLSEWGRLLYDAALGDDEAKEALRDWLGNDQRRFSIEIDPEPPRGAGKQRQASYREAATALMALPWELLHDKHGFLFHGRKPVRVRRRLPNRSHQGAPFFDLPVRILVLSPRPGDAGYFDHRSSALPLVQAVEELGDLAEVTVLTPPTIGALEQALNDNHYHIVHFDGHGAYDREHGLGGLCFEKPNNPKETDFVTGERLAEIVRDHRIPVVFLDACQGAKAEADINASVAASILAEGVTSVVAMTHSVLVPTACRFVEAFYRRLAEGTTVGSAMLAGQQALHNDTYRFDVVGAGRLHLQDWFVPVLYQEEQDPQLFTRIPSPESARLQNRRRDLLPGDLPETPAHTFIGRSQELLALERRLCSSVGSGPSSVAERAAVVRGVGGVGKTTIAVELARWLVRSHRFHRAVFVSLEKVQSPRAILDCLGRQLVPDYTVSTFGNDLEAARHPLDRALRDHATIIVVDNCESVLEEAGGSGQEAGSRGQEAGVRGQEAGGSGQEAGNRGQRAGGGEQGEEERENGDRKPETSLFALFQRLLGEAPDTRIVFTSRSPLPAPFTYTLELGNLSRQDAVALVAKVMKEHGLEPRPGDAGRTPKEIGDLVEAVHCHARALVLLAREIATRGVRATTADLAGLMADLERRNPGDRENSLYASLELSLRRLPDEAKPHLDQLAPFHGGVNTAVLSVLSVPSVLSESLVGVGLAKAEEYAHLTLDPALTPYLRARLDVEELADLTERWGKVMCQLVDFLYEQQSKDANLASRLTLLELPNLLALLDWLPAYRAPAEVVDVAGSIEQLLARLGRPAALARAVAVREAASRQLKDWSKAVFEAERLRIERLLAAGDLRQAYAAACELRKRCLAEGEQVYKGADYDIAMAHALEGRVLKIGGVAGEALDPLAEAQRRFEALPDDRGVRMAAVCLSEQGDCLMDLGRLDESAAAYEESTARAEKLDDARMAAAGKGNLGTVRMQQRRFSEALAAWQEARDIFTRLDEPATVAGAWHQIGMVHEKAGQYEQAERAYRQALAINVQQGNRSGEAATLNQLGNLCSAMGQTEEAVTFLRQAADIRVQLGDLSSEGRARNNLADELIKLRRYDKARPEILRAIECDKPYGYAAEPWKTWQILHDLEQAVGNTAAAAAARAKAIRLFLAYRRDGGENHMQSGLWCRQALSDLSEGQIDRAVAQLSSMPEEPLARTLVAILQGSRDPALADDPALDYSSAVELRLLLEQLGVTFPDDEKDPV